MGPIFRFLDYLINRCPSCGVSAVTVCTRCWHVLNSTEESFPGQGLMVGEMRPFVQRVLYAWDDRLIEPASVLRELILSAKENPSAELIQVWANEFYRRGLLDGLFAVRRNWILVPPPGRSGRGEEDHAGALAKAISDLTGGAMSFELMAFERVGDSRRSKSKPSLKKALTSSSASQKTKNRAERSEIEFRVSNSMKTKIAQAEGFIFIDDVIATGATANAAWVALGRPQAFESWAIALKINEFA